MSGSHQSKSSYLFVTIGLSVVFLLGACGSDDDDALPNDAAGDDDAAVGGDDSEGTSDGAGTGTLTTSDGTVYEITFSTCETADNDPSRIVLEGGYSMSGDAGNGFRVNFGRVGADGAVAANNHVLENEDDDVLYTAAQSAPGLTVEGGSVSGTVTMTPIGPNRPHGDSTEATIEANC